MSENVRPRRQYHHGRTPAAWAGTGLALVGFVVGSVGFLLSPFPNWTVVAIGAALVVAGVVAGWALALAGYGENHH